MTNTQTYILSHAGRGEGKGGGGVRGDGERGRGRGGRETESGMDFQNPKAHPQ